jgi:predicted MFS family arabinose efflux permease
MRACGVNHAPEVDAVRPRSALSIPNFRFLWGNNIAFFLVSNAERFIYGWLVLEGLGRGEREQGFIVFTLGLPVVLITLHAGVWADRLDRRRLLMSTQLAGAAIMAATALFVGTGRASLRWIAVSTFIAGTASAMGSPVRSSLISAIVPRAQLFSAIAINALAMTSSMILGPVIARAVGARFGFAGAFWFQAGLMALGVGFLAKLRLPPRAATGPKRSVRSETLEAVRHVWHDRNLRSLFGLLILASITINPAVMVTSQAHIKESLGRDAGDSALTLACMGVGIAITSIILIRKGDMANKGMLFQRAVIMGSTMTFLMGRSNTFTMMLIVSFFMGLAGGFYINMNQGLIQSSTPQPLMGRVMGLFVLTQAGFMPIGAVGLGLVAEKLSTGIAISGAGAIAWVVFVLVYLRNAELRRLG